MLRYHCDINVIIVISDLMIDLLLLSVLANCKEILSNTKGRYWIILYDIDYIYMT